eukprot:COSAG06_NODE_3337_length_5489_cov_1.722263_6_plen_91_part_00
MVSRSSRPGRLCCARYAYVPGRCAVLVRIYLAAHLNTLSPWRDARRLPQHWLLVAVAGAAGGWCSRLGREPSADSICFTEHGKQQLHGGW